MLDGEFRHGRLRIAIIALTALVPAQALAGSQTRSFFVDKIYGDRPQLCTVAGTGCGKPAADAWCRQAGYQNALVFRAASDKAATYREQRVQAGELCPADTCNGLQFVKCLRVSDQ